MFNIFISVNLRSPKAANKGTSFINFFLYFFPKLFLIKHLCGIITNIKQ